MWTEEQVKEYSRYWIHKDFYGKGSNPSRIVLCSYYDGCNWRFDTMRAVVEKEIKIYKQQLKMGI